MRFVSLILLLPLLAGAPAWGEHSCAGRVFNEISFGGVPSFKQQDLRRSVVVSPGVVVSAEEIEQSLQALRERELFAVVEASCPTDGRLTFILTPYERLTAVSLEGVQLLSFDRVRQTVALPLGEQFDIARVEQAAERIRKLYRNEGYYSVKVESQIEPRSVAGELLVRFLITEGEPTRVDELLIEGEIADDALDVVRGQRERLVAVVPSRFNLREFAREAVGEFRAQGYLRASFRERSRSYNELNNTMSVVFSLRLGEKFAVGFSGNRSLSERELLETVGLRNRASTPPPFSKFCRLIIERYQLEGYYFASCELQRTEEGRLEFKITEGERVYLREIEIVGNQLVSSAELKRGLRLRKRSLWYGGAEGIVTTTAVEDVPLLIQEIYQAHGISRINAKVSVEQFEPGRLRLKVEINEGEIERVRAVKLLWEGDTPPELLSLDVPLRSGDPLTPERLNQVKGELQRTLNDKGFASAEVSYAVEGSELIFTAKPGPQVRIGKITYAGNYSSLDEVITRELEVAEGGSWDLKAIQRSETQLLQTGLYNSVSFIPEDGAIDSAEENLLVKVRERDSARFEFDATFNTQDGLRLKSEISERNFRRQGETLAFLVDGFFKTGGAVVDSGRASIRYQTPHVLSTSSELISELFYQGSLETIQEYSFDRQGASFLLRSPVAERWTLNTTAQLYTERLFDVSPDAVISELDEGSSRFSIVGLELQRDGRDNPFNPRSGTFAQLNLRYAGDTMGSDVEFVAGGAQLSTFAPLDEDLVWANNLRGVVFEPLGDTDAIPISQRLFLGGHGSLRGFSRYVVGPRGEALSIVGGDSAAVFNSELRQDLSENVVGVLFLDVGQAFLRNQGSFTGDGLDFGDLRYSPGVAVGYKTPLGAILAEYGINPDPEFGERPGRFYISIGGAF